MLTVRNLPDEVHHALRVRAAHHGRSTEAEVREILAFAVEGQDASRATKLRMIVLDTNVVSEAMKPESHSAERAWLLGEHLTGLQWVAIVLVVSVSIGMILTTKAARVQK